MSTQDNGAVTLNPHIIYDAIGHDGQRRTSFENVQDVLAAIASRPDLLRAALAAPQPEPIGYIDRRDLARLHTYKGTIWPTVAEIDAVPVYAAATQPVVKESLTTQEVQDASNYRRVLAALRIEDGDDSDPVTCIEMLKSWEADAKAEAGRLAKHLQLVLEIARTWQPDYATKMDRDTLALADAEIQPKPAVANAAESEPRLHESGHIEGTKS